MLKVSMAESALVIAVVEAVGVRVVCARLCSGMRVALRLTNESRARINVVRV
jgi:hypothetical protein